MVVGIITPGPLVGLFHGVFPAAVAVAGVPEVLEDEEAIAVAGVVEFGPLGEGAAPDADEVEVHVTMETDLGVIALGAETEQLIGDDPVTALDKDGLAVDERLTATGSRIPARGDLAHAETQGRNGAAGEDLLGII